MIFEGFGNRFIWNYGVWNVGKDVLFMFDCGS